MLVSAVVFGKVLIGRQGHSDGVDLPLIKHNPVRVYFDEVCEPNLSCIAQRFVRLVDIDVARPALGNGDVSHRLERNAQQEIDLLIVRLDVHLNNDIVRNFVRINKRACRGECCSDHQQHDRARCYFVPKNWHDDFQGDCFRRRISEGCSAHRFGMGLRRPYGRPERAGSLPLAGEISSKNEGGKLRRRIGPAPAAGRD